MAGSKNKKVLVAIQPIDGGSAVHVRQLLQHLDYNHFHVFLAAPPDQTYQQICASTGATYVTIPFVRSNNPLKDIIPFWRLLKLCRAEHFTVAHFHCTKAGFLGRLAGWLTGTKVIYTPHGLLYAQTPRSLHRFIYYWMERSTMFMVAKVIFVSRSEADAAIADRIVPVNKATIVSNGVKVPQLTTIKPALPPRVVMVSRLEEPKQPEDLLRAIPLITKKYVDVVFQIVGEGSKMTELKALSRTLGITKHIQFLGFRNDVMDLLAASSVAVLCSASEGLPYAILEAMACRRPVVASRIKGVINVVQEGRTGLLYELGNAEDLANRILQLLDRPDLLREMGDNGYQLVVHDYSIERMIKNLQRLYSNNM